MEPSSSFIAIVVGLLSIALPSLFAWLQQQNKHRREESEKMVDKQISVQNRLTQLETWRGADMHRLDGFEDRVLSVLDRLEDKIDRLVER